jgi:hypothetical protein
MTLDGRSSIGGMYNFKNATNLLFSVGILDGQVTGIARHENIFYLPPYSASHVDHINRMVKMILNLMPVIEGGLFGSLDDCFKMLITDLAKQFLEACFIASITQSQ